MDSCPTYNRFVWDPMRIRCSSYQVLDLTKGNVKECHMATFRVKWKNGTVVLLEGEDIADAFNKVGYTKADIKSIAYCAAYEKGSTDHPEYPFAQFACPKCMGTLELVNEAVTDKESVLYTHGVYFYRCDECGNTTPKALDQLRAVIVMNIFCATGRIPQGPEVNRYYHNEMNRCGIAQED